MPFSSLIVKQKNLLIVVFVCFIISRLLLATTGALAQRELLPKYKEGAYVFGLAHNSWLDGFVMWDAGWYLSIINHGYMNDPVLVDNVAQQRNYAFFPAYPYLVRWVKPIFGNNAIISGLVVSNVFFLISLVLLYKIVEHRYDKEAARLSVIITTFFPNSFVFSSLMTEGMFFCLLLGIFYCAQKRQWLLACILGCVLSATRVSGIIMVLPLFYLYVKDLQSTGQPLITTKNILRLPMFFLFSVGLVAFCLFLNRQVGDPLAFIHIQSAWQRASGFYLVDWIRQLFSSNLFKVYLSWYTLLSLLPTILFIKTRQWDLVMVVLLIIAPPLYTANIGTPTASMPRYLLMAFPIFISVALLIRGKPLVQSIVIAGLALLNGALMVLWTLQSSMLC